MFKTLKSRIIASYFAIVVVSLLLGSVMFLFFLSRYTARREREELGRQVEAVGEQIRRIQEFTSRRPPFTDNAFLREQEVAERLLITRTLTTSSEILGAKLLLISGDRRVIAEGLRRPTRVKWAQAIPRELLDRNGLKVVEITFKALEGKYFCASVPMLMGSGDGGFLIAVKPVAELGTPPGSFFWFILAAGMIAFGISMMLGFYLSGALTRPLRAIATAARRMAFGEFEQKVEPVGFQETRELARDFNMMSERVKDAYERQRDFAANVSHEIRTPLTSIKGFAQSLLDGVSESEEERKRALEIISLESGRLERVVKDILLLSQIDAGELAIARREFDVIDLFRRMETIYSPLASEKGVTIVTKSSSPSIPIESDPDRVERILTNLVDNAVKYTPAGGTVTITADNTNEEVTISVRDTGPGIPQERLEKIFDRFYRYGDENRGYSRGAGLGLSISRELAATLGGRINVASREGEGSVFTLVIPA